MANKLLFLSIFLLVFPLSALAQWDFSKHAIPLDEIQSGGPPKDGIPALTKPNYLPAAEASYMRPDEQGLGVALTGVARAYPTRIRSWRELVSDRFGAQPVLVSW